MRADENYLIYQIDKRDTVFHQLMIMVGDSDGGR